MISSVIIKTNQAKEDHHRPLFETSWPWTLLDASSSSCDCDSDGDGGLNAGGQGGDGVEIDELNGDHEQTGHDVKNNQWWRCW